MANKSSKHGLFYHWGVDLRQAGQGKKNIGDTVLGSQGRLLLLVNTLFLMAEALSGTFVNVYLWKETNDYILIGLYNLSFFVSMQLTYMLGGKWLKEFNKMSCLRTGIVVSASFYLSVLILGEKAASFILLLGFLQGIGHGFFWSSFNIVFFEITSRENRDKFNGLAGVFGSFVGMISPLAAGYLISRMTGTKGYMTIFAISLGIYIGGVILSFFLKKRKSVGHYSIWEPFKILRRDDTWKNIFKAMIGQGMNESLFNFMVGLLVFIATQNEWKLGIYTFITSGVAFVSFYVVGRVIRPAWRSKALFIGTFLMAVSVLPLFLEVTFTTLLIMGIGISFFSPLFYIPAISTVFDAMGKTKNSAKQKVEYIIIRETGLNIGRLLSLGAFLLLVSWREDPIVLNSLLFAVSIALFITWFYLRRVKL
jgi:YQGE family putative transporter